MKRSSYFLLIILSVVLASCLKTEQQATGVGDALIVTKKIGGNTVYGISLYAYTYSSFASVKAFSTIQPDKTYTLKANQGNKTSFYYDTPDAEFSVTKPQASTFDFSAEFENGISNGFQDQLSDQTLPLPVIEKCVYNPTLEQVDVIWALISNADSYAVTIWDGPNFVFGSTELIKTRSNYSISASGSGWAAGFTPLGGKTYTVRLLAFLYEPGGDAYNMQASAMTETNVVWGN